jgi:hypothetical protein
MGSSESFVCPCRTKDLIWHRSEDAWALGQDLAKVASFCPTAEEQLTRDQYKREDSQKLRVSLKKDEQFKIMDETKY